MVNKIVIGKIKKIKKNLCIVEVFENNIKYIGVLHISNISDYYISNISNFFELNNFYYFLVISKKENNILYLDWKSLHSRFLKNPFKHKIQETKNNFKTLKLDLLKLEDKNT